ncbi:uncharacterized protein LOC126896561 [Daktulosphaira vitifoliae]|uniref:uncharacterized protein LOC126896561 n=1 Tax=Daktulosphaira vitifoliae TaxID=58002 RepID=UPI0021A98379|nr:uncharacterized protein LOC126896561 [Daktulosphaira vitifoliae]XP_050525420.1 uncharacterized protein LOC126896561 [Daktulosphaira vitifoliae]
MMPVMLIQHHLAADIFECFTVRMTVSQSPAHRAMRYYRIWIYTCNTVLLVCVVCFVVIACRLVVADQRRHLVPDLDLAHPSLLYAYVALAVQCGFLQLVGCMGAKTLNERLLNIYWHMLLGLLIGDAVLGVYWVYRYDKMIAKLKPALRHKLSAEYDSDPQFTIVWNALQREHNCCGVDGPQDFFNATLQFEQLTDYMAIVPDSCCYHQPEVIASPFRRDYWPSLTTTTVVWTTVQTEEHDNIEQMPIKCRLAAHKYYHPGCERALMAWIRRTADVLFVLCYCVISFLKLCFLGILKYEIREMIQKIKILHGDSARLELVNIPQATGKLLQKVEHNGSVIRVSTMRQDTLTEGCSEATKPLIKGRSVEATFRVKSANVDGNESDTNSHSALLLCDDKLLTGSSSKSNYELHELKDVNRLLITRHKNQV